MDEIDLGSYPLVDFGL